MAKRLSTIIKQLEKLNFKVEKRDEHESMNSAPARILLGYDEEEYDLSYYSQFWGSERVQAIFKDSEYWMEWQNSEVVSIWES